MSSFKAPVKKTKENPGEMYFTWYMDDLIKEGYLKSYQREAETIRILPAFPYKKEKHLKTKDNTFETFHLLSEMNYTYDFRLIWTEKALNIFTEVFQDAGHFRFNKPEFISHWINIDGTPEIVSYVDVKPHFSSAAFGGGKNSTFYTFPFIQKFLLFTKKLYINKVIPTNAGKYGINTCLFATTFTPNRYLYTDAGQQLRKIPFKKTSIGYYTKTRKEMIDSLLNDIERKNAGNNQTTLL